MLTSNLNEVENRFGNLLFTLLYLVLKAIGISLLLSLYQLEKQNYFVFHKYFLVKQHKRKSPLLLMKIPLKLSSTT